MFPRIFKIHVLPEFRLLVSFDDGRKVIYDVAEDIEQLEDFRILKTEKGLFENFVLDESRTCISWSERVDLPSDTILEYGNAVA